jgi:hypothetical protein
MKKISVKHNKMLKSSLCVSMISYVIGINGTFCVVCLSLKTPIEVPIMLRLIDQELEHFPNVTEKLAKASWVL